MKRILLAVLILVFSAVAAAAQSDDQGNPNDPTVNERANACFDGGSLEGLCNQDFDRNGSVDDYEVDWAWECGWSIIRYEYGLIPATNVPGNCHSVMPYNWLCFTSPFNTGVQYLGEPNTASNIVFHDNPSCFGGNVFYGADSSVIFANNLEEARAVCEGFGTVLFIDLISNIGYTDSDGVYGCDYIP